MLKADLLFVSLSTSLWQTLIFYYYTY